MYCVGAMVMEEVLGMDFAGAHLGRVAERRRAKEAHRNIVSCEYDLVR